MSIHQEDLKTEQRKSSAVICGRNGRRFTQKECRENLQPGVAEKLRSDLREKWPADLRGKNAGRTISWEQRKSSAVICVRNGC